MSFIEARDPAGNVVRFYEHNHTYTTPQGQYLTSGTTFIKKFFPEFDAKKIAQKCAGHGKYENMTTEQILDAWAKESKRGRTEGTCAHAYADARLRGNSLPEPISKRCVGLFKSVDLGLERLLKHYDYVASEIIVFDLETIVAGTIDLVMYDPSNKRLLILDWKNNKQIKTNNPYQRAFKPIDHLEDCDLVKYSLQLNLYKKIVLKNSYFDDRLDFYAADLGLIHLQPGMPPVMIKVDDYMDEINLMLYPNKFS